MPRGERVHFLGYAKGPHILYTRSCIEYFSTIVQFNIPGIRYLRIYLNFIDLIESIRIVIGSIEVTNF